MKKKQKPPQAADKNILTLLKTIEDNIHKIKTDINMIKVDYVLKDSTLRGLTREVERNREEIKTLRKELEKMRDDFTADIVQLHDKIDNGLQALREEAKKYHNEVMTQLDYIVGRIKKFDEEHDILTYRQTNHGQRISKLETHVFGKPAE